MNTYLILIIIHLIGTSLGVGGATVSDALFFNVLKNNSLDKKELAMLNVVSTMVWLGLIILVLSGFGFLLYSRIVIPEAGNLFRPNLWAKLIVVSIIFLNGLLMHWKILPILKRCVGKKICNDEFVNKSKLIFSSGAVSIISWYSALIVGTLSTSGIRVEFSNIILTYLAAIILGIIGANIFGKIVINHLQKK